MIRHGCQHGHAHGTVLWMPVYLLTLFRISRTLTRTRITDTDHKSLTYGLLASCALPSFVNHKYLYTVSAELPLMIWKWGFGSLPFKILEIDF